jgi:hypothetical protein
MHLEHVIRVAALVLGICFFLTWGTLSVDAFDTTESASFTGFEFARGIDGEPGTRSLFTILIAAGLALLAPSLMAARRISQGQMSATVLGCGCVSLLVFFNTWDDLEGQAARSFFVDVDLSMQIGAYGTLLGALALAGSGIAPFLAPLDVTFGTPSVRRTPTRPAATPTTSPTTPTAPSSTSIATPTTTGRMAPVSTATATAQHSRVTQPPPDQVPTSTNPFQAPLTPQADDPGPVVGWRSLEIASQPETRRQPGRIDAGDDSHPGSVGRPTHAPDDGGA